MKFLLYFLTGFAVLPGITALTSTTSSVNSNATDLRGKTTPIAAQDQSINGSFGFRPHNTSLGIRTRNTSLGIRAEDDSIATFHPDCGLKKPSAQEWKTNLKAIRNFTRTNFKNFVKGGADSFVIHLRDRYAKKVSPSSLTCDASGSISDCTIGSCLNLDDDVPVKERQIAYLVFEQISGHTRMMQNIARATRSASFKGIQYVPEIMGNFFSAETKQEASRLFYSSSVRTANTTKLDLKKRKAKKPPKPPPPSNTLYDKGQVQAWLTSQAAWIQDQRVRRAKNINDEFSQFMKGKPDRYNKTIIDLLTDPEFRNPDLDYTESMVDSEQHWLYAAIVNHVWKIDRPYLLDVDALAGCEYDRRGHPDYRICLPEYPKRSFWLFAIGSHWEHDLIHDTQQQVGGPTNFYAFHREDQTAQGKSWITREDIVRSSLFVHQNKLIVDHTDDTSRFGTFGYLGSSAGKVGGAFSIAVCRNPGGEAISSVWHDKGRNYPCMCGNFGWENGWSMETDETPRFLQLGGFIYSEDWEDYCSDWNLCKGHEDVDLYAILTAQGIDERQKYPKKLKHPFYKCKDSKKHSWGTPEHQPGYPHG